MNKSGIWKWLILVVLTCGSIAAVMKSGIRYGLDLQGGTSFTVKIDDEELRRQVVEGEGRNLKPEEQNSRVNELLRDAQARALEVLRNRIDQLGIAEPIIYPGKDNRIVIQLPGADAQKREDAKQSIESVAFLAFRMVHDRNDQLVEALFDKGLAPAGFVIHSTGSQGRFYAMDAAAGTVMDRAAREKLARFHTPDARYEMLLEKNEIEGRTLYKPFFVAKRPQLTGENLSSAGVDVRATGEPVVTLRFDAKGRKYFSSTTGDYAPGGPRNPSPNGRRYLAIVLDKTLYSAPYIREPIHSGRAEISGSFTMPEARFLANVLNAGALPAPVKIVEERTVSASLGEDSIRSGKNAVMIGMLAVVFFMLLYYRLSGFVANIALLLNLVLLPLGMIIAAGFLGIFAREGAGSGPIQLPVLTLPGIAGIVLTIGMAVDANVLIYERMREEAREGRRLWTVICAGYDRAFLAIFDSNLTTLLSGIIMFIFGSGPIRGFAVTLCAGIIVSMYTALVVTKMLFSVLTDGDRMKSLRMMSLIGQTSIDFLGKRKPAMAVSLAIILGTGAFIAWQVMQSPGRILGVDFTGGTAVVFSVDKRVPVQDVRKALEPVGLGDAHIQYHDEYMEGDDTGSALHVKTGIGTADGPRPSEVVETTLTKAFADAGFKVIQTDEVGPQVGKELQVRAIWAIALSLVGMIIYLSLRFEFGFALGAIAALTHDVLVTAGIYCLLGRQLSLTIVAALLTIVGYSVNDTIVIFDRIREDLKLVRNKSFAEIANLSINQTLSRTLLTSLTVLITVVVLLVVGGGAINDFALALFIGLIAGTYSTVFIATPVVLAWYKNRRPEFGHKTA